TPSTLPSTLSLHDALPISKIGSYTKSILQNSIILKRALLKIVQLDAKTLRDADSIKVFKIRPYSIPHLSQPRDRDKVRVAHRERSEEHTSELQSREKLVCR